MSKINIELLGELASTRRGITYSESALRNNPEDGLPYINMKSFLKDGGYNKDGLKYYAGFHTTADLNRENDLLIANTDVTRDGDIIGVPALLPNELKGSGVLFSHHVTRLSVSSKIDTSYLYYLLCSDEYRRAMKRYARGTTVLMLDMHGIQRIPVQYPASPEAQKNTTRVLGSIDTAIEKTEALIAKYQQIKAGLMHDLFTRGVLPNGQLRPPREQAPELYQETAIGWIPREWECQRLGLILAKSGGYLQTGPFGSQLHAAEYQDDGFPVVMPQDINDGLIQTTSIARISESRAASLARHRLKPGDIIIARRGELSRAAAVGHAEVEWICGTGCFLLRLGRTDLNHYFFSHIYRHDFIQRQIAGMQVGSTMPSLNNDVMSRLFFPFPSTTEQDEITRRLDLAEQKIGALHDELSKLKQQKLGLMHDLLTGKVPVKGEEPEVVDG